MIPVLLVWAFDPFGANKTILNLIIYILISAKMMHNFSRFGDISCVVAKRDIEAGEEIFTNYGKGKEDKV